MPVDLGDHRAPLSANVCIGQVLAEIFNGIGGGHVVGLEFGVVVTVVLR